MSEQDTIDANELTTETEAGPVCFVDTSAIVALVDQADAVHTQAVEAYTGLMESQYRLFTTNHVIAETFELLSNGVGPDAARRWLRDHQLPVYHSEERDEQRARALVIASRNSRGLSYVDAVSRVVMERFGVEDAFVVDPYVLSDRD